MFTPCSFLGLDYTPLGAPYDCIMAILDCSDTVQPFVVTAYPIVYIILGNHCYHADNVSGFSRASMK